MMYSYMFPFATGSLHSILSLSLLKSSISVNSFQHTVGSKVDNGKLQTFVLYKCLLQVRLTLFQSKPKQLF